MSVFAPCPVPATGPGLLTGLLGYVDCQTQAIGANGYEALATPGSSLSVALTGMLVLFVAMLGYRMVLGHGLGARDGVLTMIKIGVVLTLAFSWPAYRVLAYDVALRAPAEMAADIGGSAGLPGAGGGLVARLDGLDRAFVTLAIAEQTLPAPTIPTPPGTPPPTAFDPYALGAARIVYLTATGGSLAGVRLAAGLLLALGPLFVAFLLFRGTGGLFEGWVRALAGTALGALGISIALGVELAFLEPRLAELVARRTMGEPITGAGVELFVITALFALAVLAVLYFAIRVAAGFSARWADLPAMAGGATRHTEHFDFRQQRSERSTVLEAGRTRAAAIVDAVAATQRRETAYAAPAMLTGSAGRPLAASTVVDQPIGRASNPTDRRRVQTRASAAKSRRDAR